MIVHILSIGVSTDNGASLGSSSLSGTVREAGTLEINVDWQLPAATTDQLESVAFTLAALQSIILVSDQTVILKTNSPSTPSTTITLLAGVPFTWSRSSGYYGVPFAADVTAFYLSSTPAARVRGKILLA